MKSMKRRVGRRARFAGLVSVVGALLVVATYTAWAGGDGSGLRTIAVATPCDGSGGGPVAGIEQAPLGVPRGISDWEASIEAGKTYLREMQADDDNDAGSSDNAGNGFDAGTGNETPDDPDDAGWDWRVTSPPALFHHTTGASSTNLYGPCGLGVYDAYIYGGSTDTAALRVMQEVADYYLTSGTAYASEIQFLLKYQTLVGGTAYKDAAKAKWDGKMAGYTGGAAEYAAVIRDGRAGQGYENGIIPWDIAAYVVAAQELHAVFPAGGPAGLYSADAVAMAEVVYDDVYLGLPGYFDLEDDKTDSWYNLGVSGVIDCFKVANVHTDKLNDLVDLMLESQFPFGGFGYYYQDSWGWQTTAYCVMTLDRFGSTYRSEMGLANDALALTQDASGGWVYGSGNHYPEVGAECVSALTRGGAVILEIYPSLVPDEEEPRVNLGDAPTGFGPDSWQNSATGKVNWHARYLADGDYLSALFPDKAATLTVNELESIRYWTKRPGGTTAGQDWAVYLYTRPPGDASWYGKRFINNYEAHTAIDVWTQYSTDSGMTFRRTSGTQHGHVDFDTLKATYGTELVEMISVQTMSNWSGVFDGYMDGLTITLMDGSVGMVNFVGGALTLEPDADCYEDGETVSVGIWMRDVPEDIVGGQFFLAYDDSKLMFLSAVPESPFTELTEVTSSGLIDYAVQIPPTGSVTGDQLMATLTFTAYAQICTETDLITWRAHDPPSRLSDELGGAVYPLMVEMDVIDDEAPTITCPGDVTVECDSLPAVGTASATDNCDADPVVTYDGEVRIDGTCEDTYTLERTWTATDYCGNSASCTQTITVQDTTDPEITCPDDVTVECDSVPAVGTASATDNCDADPAITYDGEVRIDGPCDDTYTLERTWTATDNCGNTDTCTQTITVQDTTDPEITCPDDVTVECDSVPAVGTASATDNCDADPAITYDGEVRIDGPCDDTYTLERTWTATDNCGNTDTCTQTITVQDTTDPEITCPDDVTVECDSVPAVGTASATDNCDADPAITYDGEVRIDGPCDDTYTLERTWTATDNCGNTDTCTQTITVQDTTDPVFVQTCPLTPITVYSDAGTCEAAGSTVNPTTPTATDNCSTPSVDFVRSDGKPNLLDAYEAIDSPITITWTAEDDCGNTATCTQTVTVIDDNQLLVDVQLSPTMVAGPITRCITFELWECGTPSSVTVEEVLTFNSGLASATIEVPCGDYTCITARDTLHTLRRTDEDFGVIGTQYVADFTGDPAGGGDWLIGGNLNDDFWIDILDFGVYSWQWSVDYDGNPADGSGGNTNCTTTPYPHADVNGDSEVSSADFTFIQIHFWLGHEANCCGQLGFSGDGPLTEISVEELRDLGLGHLSVGDLNGDGWLDMEDVSAFLQGVRPEPQLPVEEAAEVGVLPLTEAGEAEPTPILHHRAP